RPENFPEKAVLDQAKYDLETLASELELTGVEVAAAGGDPSKQTLAHIDSEDMDLVVIASKGRTGLDRMLIGSVADDLLRQCPVPVFTVKPGDASLLPGDTGAAEAASA
ncbi:MAG: universal stress protein, partial [Spiribacter salinus]